MRTRYFMLTGFVNHATAETRKLKCTIAGTFTDSVSRMECSRASANSLGLLIRR
jgi:hypothetical protein